MSRRLWVGLMGLLAVTACARPAPTLPYPGAPWTNPDGEVVDPATLALYSDDCPGRETAAFLEVMWPLDGVPGEEPEMRRYVRDPDNVMPTAELLAPFDRASSLPREARFSGYESPPFQLWVGADDDLYLYLVNGSRVEALPRAIDETVPCT